MTFQIWQTISTATAGVGLTGTLAYFSPWLLRQHQLGRVRRRASQNRTLALTYDDGPSATLTPQLLDLLQRRNARATFFMLGRHARRYPEIADRIIREHHDVGCHSQEHLNAWKAAPWRAIADIESGYDHLSAWVQPDGMFRPPYGKMTLPTYLTVRRRGAPVYWWTVDSGDTNQQVPRANQVADAICRQKGGIVLMHDLDRGKERNYFVLEATSVLLDVAEQESLKVIPLRELWS